MRPNILVYLRATQGRGLKAKVVHIFVQALYGKVRSEPIAAAHRQDLRLAFIYVGKIRGKQQNIGDLRPLSVSPDR